MTTEEKLSEVLEKVRQYQLDNSRSPDFVDKLPEELEKELEEALTDFELDNSIEL